MCSALTDGWCKRQLNKRFDLQFLHKIEPGWVLPLHRVWRTFVQQSDHHVTQHVEAALFHVIDEADELRGGAWVGD